MRLRLAEWLVDLAADLMVLAGRLCIAAGRNDYAQNIVNVLEYGASHERMNEPWSERSENVKGNVVRDDVRLRPTQPYASEPESDADYRRIVKEDSELALSEKALGERADRTGASDPGDPEMFPQSLKQLDADDTERSGDVH